LTDVTLAELKLVPVVSRDDATEGGLATTGCCICHKHSKHQHKHHNFTFKCSI